MMIHERVQGAYAPVNGLEMYYEIHGEGQPLVLLHGALSAIGTSFGALLPQLSQTRQVIAIEQQGHGHTADTDRPLTFEQMADDTAVLLDYLGVASADIFGYSLGTGVALHLALRHPDKVHRLVLATTSYNNNGFIPDLLDALEGLQPEQMRGTPWQAEYTRIAPQPENWETLVAKTKYLDLHMPELSEETVRSISAPTLLIFADADIVRLEHAVQMFRLLGGGVPVDASGLSRSQLAILPGTSHISLVERADLLLPMIPAFLDRPL
jgi:pimeloyl-ACP methyl ester carboxylesterase